MMEPKNIDLTSTPQRDPRLAKHADRNVHLFAGNIVAERKLLIEKPAAALAGI